MAHDPNKVAEELATIDAVSWKTAIASELESLIRHSTFVNEDVPTVLRLINAKFVFSQRNPGEMIPLDVKKPDW